MDEILEISREINYDNLVSHFKDPTSSISYTKFGGPVYTYDQLKKGDKRLQQVEEEQKRLGQIKSGDPEKKSQTQLNTIKNVKNLYNSRQAIFDLLNGNSRIRSEAIYK